MADILVSNLGSGFCEVDICRDIESMTFQADDVCLVSVPSFAGRVPAVAIERLKKFSGNGAKAILNCACFFVCGGEGKSRTNRTGRQRKRTNPTKRTNRTGRRQG